MGYNVLNSLNYLSIYLSIHVLTMVVVAKIQAAAGMLSKMTIALKNRIQRLKRIHWSWRCWYNLSLERRLLIMVGGREKVFNIHSWAILRRNNSWHDRWRGLLLVFAFLLRRFFFLSASALGIPKVIAFDKLILVKPLVRFKRTSQCRKFFVLSVFMHAATTWAYTARNE